MSNLDQGASLSATGLSRVEPASGLNGFATSIPSAVRLSANERRVLFGMWQEHSSEYDDFCGDGASWFLTFKGIQQASGIEPYLVRRTVRALARKGLAEYSNGLCSDDGDLRGAGYGLTRKGRVHSSALFECDECQGRGDFWEPGSAGFARPCDACRGTGISPASGMALSENSRSEVEGEACQPGAGTADAKEVL